MTLETLYNAVGVRVDYADVWWADKEIGGVTRLGMTRHRVTEQGLADFIGTSARFGVDVFQLREAS